MAQRPSLMIKVGGVCWIVGALTITLPVLVGIYVTYTHEPWARPVPQSMTGIVTVGLGIVLVIVGLGLLRVGDDRQLKLDQAQEEVGGTWP